MTEVVTIVMATRNGAAHLPEQLASIAAQTADWRLIAGDDASQDATMRILTEFSAKHPGKVRLVAGPGRGVSAHFLHLIALAAAEGAGTLALADQDDVWQPDKLAEALAALDPYGRRPALFLAGLALWDGVKPPERPSLKETEPEFRHAMVQNIAPGNAMVVNAAALKLLAGQAALGVRPAWHDWWIYQLVTAAGGAVVKGAQLQVWYRQHPHNTVGEAVGAGRIRRSLARAASGKARQDLGAQWAALRLGSDALTPEARELLAAIERLPGRGFRRALGVWRLGLRRRGRLGRLSVALAALGGAL